MTLDELRSAYPLLGFALYALEPRGQVIFEVHTPTGDVHTFAGATAEAALLAAFPVALPVMTATPPIDLLS